MIRNTILRFFGIAPPQKVTRHEIGRLSEEMKVQLAALESAANGIIITDTHGIVQWVNPGFTRLTGYTADEIVGRNLKLLNSGIHDPQFFKDLWTTIMAGEVWHNEVVNRRKDGSIYTEEMTITPVLDEKGSIARFVAVKQDISERKKLEEFLLKEKERMESELDVARQIQMSMLPKTDALNASGEDIQVVARLIPAREVGGDFFDCYWIDDENFCFFIGDVSGKGVPAALMMAVTKTLLKAGSTSERSTAKILTTTNNELSRDNENYMFVTVFIGILNTTTGYLTYSNAGHNPSFRLKQDDPDYMKLSDLHGVVLGAMEGFQYGETVVSVKRGERLFLYTDGVTEARNLKDELFSEDRLLEIFEQYGQEASALLVQHVIDAVASFENEAPQADDVTLMVVDFKEQQDDSVIDYLFTSISNEIDQIGEVVARFEQFAGKHGVSLEIVQQINIVFDELLSNTIKYAFNDDEAHEIEIKIRFYRDKLTFTILDDGMAFNPFDQIAPDTSLSINEREIGGLGVHLVKFLVDDYRYEYKVQVKKNSVHFTKHI